MISEGIYMKFIRNFMILAIAVFGFSLTDVSAQSARKAAPRTIEQKVFKEIIKLPYYGLFDNIKYQVNGGTVILSGKVYSLGLRKSAERVVKKIDGVESVVNNIEELPPSSFDDQIRRQLIREFSRTGGLYRYLQGVNPSVRLVVDRGRVELEGFVANRGDKNLMNILANGIPGVFNVQNNLVVESEIDR
jgi:hyperosmotically inducible periplasmic protein